MSNLEQDLIVPLMAVWAEIGPDEKGNPNLEGPVDTLKRLINERAILADVVKIVCETEREVSPTIRELAKIAYKKVKIRI